MPSTCECCDIVSTRLPSVLGRKEKYWTWIVDFQTVLIAGTRGCDFCRFIDREVLRPWYTEIGEPQRSFNEDVLDAVKHSLRLGVPTSIRKTCKRQRKKHWRMVICAICSAEDWTAIGQDYFCGRCLEHQGAAHSSRQYCKPCLRLAARYLANAVTTFGTTSGARTFRRYKLQLRISFSGGVTSQRNSDLMIVLEPHLGSGSVDYIIERATSVPLQVLRRNQQDDNIGSDRAVSQVLDWIMVCDEHGCYPKTRPLPTRVIDVNRGSDPSLVRLTCPNGRTGKYAALSYCWSSIAQPMTTLANVVDRQDHLKLATLPQTIRDAISLTRRLGIPYLWVDSLCIIQDSDQDRALEIAKMCDTFANAYITISASNAATSETGFLRKFPVEPGRIMLKQPDGSNEVILIRKLKRHQLCDEPIYRRAWTLQERMLSARVVSFGQSLTWKCRKLKALDYHTGDMWIEEASGIGELYPLNTHLEGDDIPDFNTLWKETVHLYTTMRLTFESDKLPALAGVATAISSHQPDNIYLAGLWSKQLSQQLMWWLDGVGSRPAKWRAPSWSWASMDTAVDYFTHPNAEPLIQYILSDIVPLPGGSIFGALQKATLTVRGRLCNTRRWLYKYHGRVHEIVGSGDLIKEEDLFSFDELKSYRLDTRDDHLFISAHSVDWNNKTGSKFVVLHSVQTWLLPVAGTDGLVLERNQDGTYRRIGWFVIEGLSEKKSVEWSDEMLIQLV